ncbi:MAG: diacylglycerol kinase family protein [Lachnospiraceae bacterium]|nr:diacylglycerol kinase family protein [Lachnospiraceae bacterium]
MAKYVILYNSLSGNGKGLKAAEELKAKLQGDEVRFDDITKITDYGAYFEKTPEDEMIVICGGDGTLNHFINDCDTDHLQREILFYPAGTGNDFMNDVRDKVGEPPFVLNPYLKDLPEVTVKGKKYKVINGTAFGIPGYCCEEGDRIRQEKPGTEVNYTSIAIKGLLFKFKPVNATVIVDGLKRSYKKVWLTMTMNGRFIGGGMNATPDQKRLDPEHKSSTLIFYGSGKLKTLMIFPGIFKGEHVKHTDCVEVLQGHDVIVEFDKPCALQVDGETILGVTSYHMVSKK